MENFPATLNGLSEHVSASRVPWSLQVYGDYYRCSIFCGSMYFQVGREYYHWIPVVLDWYLPRYIRKIWDLFDVQYGTQR